MPAVVFPAPWTSIHRVDPRFPHHLVNADGQHLFILNKTGWAYFGCQDPEGYLKRAKEEGITVIRVALEGRPYWDTLHIDIWPFGGTREKPDYASFNGDVWDRIEERVKLAGRYGIGLDIILFHDLHPRSEEVERLKPYVREAVRRLGRYTNVLCWELQNEWLQNEAFQDQVGPLLRELDPLRPVITSDHTADNAAWPHKPWVGMATTHTCTGSGNGPYTLAGWYLPVARNTRSHDKPAWCSESGREKRHKNDDGVHRRKQGWIWYAAGCYWTWHT